MFFPTLRYQDKHKFVIQLKKYLNELVKPSPNLPLDDVVNDRTISAVRNFKNQWVNRVATSKYDQDHRNEITPGLWAMIGRALTTLSKDRLLKDLREIKDNEIRSLLLGMDATNNLNTYYTAEMEACDAKIASILGGEKAVAAANGFEPDALAIIKFIGGRYNYYRGDTIENGKPEIGHLSAYIMHLYGSTDGTRFGVDGKTYTDIYIPDGFEMKKGDALKQLPTPTEAVVHFYYKRLGNVEDTTLLLMHVKDFNPIKKGNRWHIGKIGGKGGQITNIDNPYLHSHFALLKGDVGLGFAYKNGKYDSFATMEYRAKIGIRFSNAFC